MFDYKSVLILNGSLPNIQANARLIQDKFIIGVDVFPNMLQEKSIFPDVIIGDLDSADLKNISSKVEIIKDADQYTTDFEKAIGFIRKRRITPTLVLGAGGGEIDHVLANIYTLVKYFKTSDEIFFLFCQNNNMQLGIIINEYLNLDCTIGDKVSLFPFPTAIVTTRGLKYPLNKDLIEQTKGILAVRNEVLSNNVEISVAQGLILCVTDFHVGF